MRRSMVPTGTPGPGAAFGGRRRSATISPMRAPTATDDQHAGDLTRHEAPARSGSSAPIVVLGLGIAVWVATFSVLVYLKHDRFASVDFDMGIHDQSVWLLAHFRGFLTVRGLQVFGHHATPGYALFVPFYWIGAGPHFLNITQVVVAGLGAVPVFLLARYRTGRAWIGTALGIAFLLHPALQYFMSELFHPEVIAITPLLCAYYCSVR